jgi:hypothetical protein
MTDIAKIAAGLTKAQREAVLSAEHLLGGAMQVWHAHTSTIKSIHKKGLCSKPDWRNLATETPLGQQVRDYLKENNHDPSNPPPAQNPPDKPSMKGKSDDRT